MAKVEINRVAALPAFELGEAPHWDADSKSLLFVDAFQSRIHRYFPDTNRYQTLTLEPSASGTSVTFIIPIEGQLDLFLISVGRDVGVIRWSTKDPDQHTTKLHSLAVVDADRPLNILNDGKCDANGRLWAGTHERETSPAVVEKERGKLFMFSEAMKPELRVDKVNLSNGLAWSADGKSFYYIDTVAASVDTFDVDVANNTISGRRKIVDYNAVGLKENYPDGMTIDTDGNLWVANFNGAKVLCISPKENRILRTIDLPIQNPTCVAWGGPDYSVLYLTTAHFGLSKEEIETNPHHGALFAITGLGARGTAPNKAKLTQNIIDKIA